MTGILRESLSLGAAELGRWTSVLDRINVFPVADGDTGRNLALSLAPLKEHGGGAENPAEALLLSARGNSGNIASQFLSALLEHEGIEGLPDGAARGCRCARSAVADPQPGTMITLFEALADALAEHPPGKQQEWVVPVVERLSQVVLETRSQQERLAQAGVVDAGALGMWIVLERCLRACQPPGRALPTLAQRFGDYLQVRSGWRPEGEGGFCVDAVLKIPGRAEDAPCPDALGESMVAITCGDFMKVHVHGADLGEVKRRLANLGEVVQLASDDMGEQSQAFLEARQRARVHLLTDAAGTFTADDAARYGVTVLDSYVQLAEGSVPESRMPPDLLYAAMARGEPVSTAQASTAERRTLYRSALELGKPVLYLAVGSAFTGNVQAAREFGEAEGCGDRFKIIDSGAASGRLGIVALALARLIRQGASLDEATAFAASALEVAEEWVFLDQLKYLARGGRLSRTAAFFGDTLRMKPVVAPRPSGAEKVGVVRRGKDQLPFLLSHLEALPPERQPALLLLQHTDNEARLREEILPELRRRYPEAELLVRRISLTSGAHMGPGTWAVACLPALDGLGPKPASPAPEP